MPRKSAEHYTKVRARVDSGAIQCGSGAHVALIDFEVEVSKLPARDREILRLAAQGWNHVSIAEQFGLSRSRVSHLIEDFLGWNEY